MGCLPTDSIRSSIGVPSQSIRSIDSNHPDQPHRCDGRLDRATPNRTKQVYGLRCLSSQFLSGPSTTLVSHKPVAILPTDDHRTREVPNRGLASGEGGGGKGTRLDSRGGVCQPSCRYPCNRQSSERGGVQIVGWRGRRGRGEDGGCIDVEAFIICTAVPILLTDHRRGGRVPNRGVASVERRERGAQVGFTWRRSPAAQLSLFF